MASFGKLGVTSILWTLTNNTSHLSTLISKMTVMEGDEMQNLWSLIADLSNQLSNNRQLCENLQAQAQELKVSRGRRE